MFLLLRRRKKFIYSKLVNSPFKQRLEGRGGFTLSFFSSYIFASTPAKEEFLYLLSTQQTMDAFSVRHNMCKHSVVCLHGGWVEYPGGQAGRLLVDKL